MSAESSSRLAQWWLHGVGTLDRAQPLVLAASREEWSAAIAARGLRWVQRRVRHWAAARQRQDVDELLHYARRIERDMPGLAADLRAAALRHDAPLA